MTKFYLPPGLPADIGPVYNHEDIIYMRFVKGDRTVSVVKYDPAKGGLVLELFPTESPDKFEGEAFCSMEDRSPRRVLERPDIKDEVWLGLLDGKGIPQIQSRYSFEMLGTYPSGSYKFGEGDEFRTFHIEEMEEPSPKT